MSSPEDEYPPLCQISRAPSGYFQPDPVVPWLGLEYDGQCGWQRLESPETGVRAEFGLRPNRGDGGGYGVQIHYMGARFFDRHNSSEESLPAEQGRMIGAVLAPHHGRLPEEANFYCACDSIDEDITQVARVLLDQYSVEELFGCGSLLVVVEHEFTERLDGGQAGSCPALGDRSPRTTMETPAEGRHSGHASIVQPRSVAH